MPVVVHGLRELQQAFSLAEKDLRTFTRGALREVAEPIQSDAQRLATERIPKLAIYAPRRSALSWHLMRIGITRTLVYVAPKQRGIRARGPDPRRRPHFGALLMDRAMDPALHRHEADLVRNVDRALERVTDHFNGGPL